MNFLQKLVARVFKIELAPVQEEQVEDLPVMLAPSGPQAGEIVLKKIQQAFEIEQAREAAGECPVMRAKLIIDKMAAEEDKLELTVTPYDVTKICDVQWASNGGL